MYTVERDAHVSACKREPGMGREADGLRLRTRAYLPCVTIFQHRPPRRPRILNSKLPSKITGKQASRCWLTLEDNIMRHFFYVFFCLMFHVYKMEITIGHPPSNCY